MAGFEYNSVDFDTVRDVDIISRESQEYQNFLQDVYESNTESQYEEWARKYPDKAQEFKERAERVLEEPIEVVADIFGTAQNDCKRICGKCVYSRDDSFRDGDQHIVCWENQPNPRSNRPRKLSRGSDFATDCGSFKPTDEELERHGVDSRLRRDYFMKSLMGENGADEQRKAALKYAYYQTWTFSDVVDTESYTFSPNREEALLRHLNSDKSNESPSDVGEGGRRFEYTVRNMIEHETDLPLLNRVFRIQHYSGNVSYKEMDVHTRQDDTPILAELFTQRIWSKKKDQLRDYERLYECATGFEPKTYLVTDEIVEWVENDSGELEQVRRRKHDAGVVDAGAFLNKLSEQNNISLAELKD